MTIISSIKLTYHLFCFLFLFYIAFFFNLPHSKYIKIILIIISFIHLYDCLWFYNNTGNAPI